MTRFRIASREEKQPSGSRWGTSWVRLACSFTLCLAFALTSPGLIASHGSAASCNPGWTLISDQDNSFRWADVGLGAVDSVGWTGSVKLLINYDASCYVLGLKTVYTGPLSGGTLTLTGSPLVSFTVQYPDPFSSYSNVGVNAYGDLVSWNPPAGTYLAYEAKITLDINARGADEFDIKGRGVPGAVTNVEASFSLPLALLGHTIKAQMHVGPDKCQCKVTSVDVPAGQAPPSPWAVYVHAHEDDWQLFLTPNSIQAYQAGYNLLLVYVTAGDGGASAFYWHSREEAAMASVRYMVGSGSESATSATICYSNPSSVCHAVVQWKYGTTVSIFMRLPDGNSDGGGFPSTNLTSLAKLRDGNISSIQTVDGSTTYNSWEDLYLTVAAIINAYAPYDSTTKVNAPDFDRVRQSYEGLNCNGCSNHPDHLAVADAVYAITVGAGAPWSREWFIDYPICWADSRYPANLDATAYQVKKALFMAYNDRFKELTGLDSYTPLQIFWENCFRRQYSRVV